MVENGIIINNNRTVGSPSLQSFYRLNLIYFKMVANSAALLPTLLFIKSER